MAKLKSTKVADEAIYSCLQMLGRLWKIILNRLLRDSRLGPGGGHQKYLRRYYQK
jgi:hypothetical protein